MATSLVIRRWRWYLYYVEADKPIAVRIDERRLGVIDALADEANISRSAMIRQLIDEAVNARHFLEGGPSGEPSLVVTVARGTFEELEHRLRVMSEFVLQTKREAEVVEAFCIRKGQRQ